MPVIRSAMPHEMEALAQIGLSAWCKGIKPLVPAPVAVKIERSNPFLSFLRELGSRVLIAEIDGELAGLGACEHEDDTISDIWVSPAFEGRGAGSALIAALEAQIAERGHTEARIHVAAANERALRLYQNLGYRQLWRKLDFDPILETDLEKIGLSKSL
ncbi:GNAT family N-acetyltransferase [Sinorhizobium terangae]|uniref:GNAT family N-acetyltransferase n=1 Tax=Sinorhizobium terangae TaxID=110322 RepID=A0A6N7LDJ3_SINTE|nr:GNAT family N-acetyltransferase [Sinorhizobium terangae]MBB4189821.1 ribosomal-protein-alanine N-acetyltransferase [Sinorhizobium terangae]MQX14774.1 GNAT family N-acetyltransferase [Sinorhizobium terangae]WFU46605.1 GNAT family N-acetyltransferase [Sinorhizobium terangae]